MSIRPSRLTVKERRYVRNRAESGFDDSKRSKVKAAIAAGYSAPHQAVNRIENSPRIQSVIQQEMDSQHLTLKAVVQKHKQLLDCKHPFRPKQDDNTVQLQAMKEAYKLHDVYPSTKIDIDKTERHYNVSIQAYRRAEEITGEKIIDVVPIEEEEDIGLVETL